MGVFDELPLPPEKAYLREEISKIDETWTAARFDSLPHVVHILTSKDREAAAQFLKEQSDVIEEVVDEVVQSYHSGFNRAIQNYSQILRLFSESTESIGVLKVDLAEAKKHLSARNKQLHQLWYRSVTLRHIISLLDQIEDIAKVPARIEKLIAEKQYYAAVQLHLQSIMMLERGLQTVGALQDVRSELTKLRGVLFYKILEDLHAHLYNKGEYSVAGSMMLENDDDVPTTTYVALTAHNSQSRSRRTKSLKGDNQTSLQIDGSFDGHDEEGTLDSSEEATLNGNMANTRVNGSDVTKDASGALRQMPTWLSNSTPDEFLEIIRKSDAPLHVKYLQTMVECLCMLGKVSAAGAMICQRLRPTIHETITSKIKAHADLLNSSRSSIGQGFQTVTSDLHFIKGQLESYQLPKQKRKNGISIAGTLLAVSPVSPLMAPGGKAQVAAKELLDSILDAAVRIFENHVVVGELLEAKVSLHADMNTPKSVPGDVSWNPDSETSQVTGGYSIGFSLTVLQSECQQLICEILRATPEAASADAAVQTARLANKTPSKEKRDGSENGLTFAFRFTDATISLPNQGVDIVRQGWNRKGPNVLQEGYGSAAVLPEEGIYLAASIYRPVLQFTDKIASMLPTKYSQLSNDGLLAFVENFVKDHFLPTMFVDYRKGVQQAISSPAAFRPRAHVVTTYTPSIEKGRPVLQGLLAIDYLTKEVLGWAQAMPKFANDLVNYVQTFLERTYERCRTSYMEAVLEKQSYMLIGRHDIEKLMRLDPSSAYLPNLQDPFNLESNSYDAETSEAELELSELLLNLRPIKQENLIHDENKLILLASLSDSLEYVADSIERLGQTTQRASNHIGGKHHSHSDSAPTRSLASFSQDYRKLAIDCLKVLRIEMQLETIFHMQEMTNTKYLDDQDAEEPDDFVISLTAQITRRDEEMAPFISNAKRNYIFGGICGVAGNVSVKALAAMKSINLFGVQQICRNSIALEQCVSRTAEMLDDALGLMGLKDHEGNRFLHPPCAEYICARKCAAPYVIQNLTSVPLLYHVYNGHINPNDIYDPDLSHAKYVQPGSASTIYMDENDEQQHYSPYHSSERLNEPRPSGLAHRYITVQLEGTYMLSDPISMDLVGLTCFNANFSKSYNENDDDGRMNTAPTFVVPVVLDVSALRYSKSIRIYSTVVLLNATSAPLELRFDIPFGVSPMIFDPIHPGQQFPLPLHLAEAGCVRWRPMGNSYLWSEAHKLSNLLSVNSKEGNFKSFICYPSHPSSHPFRCCLSVKSISLTSSGWLKNNHSVNDAKKHCIHHLILSAPLVINNFLPKEILLISESGGLNHTVRVSEVETSIYHIDLSHDLGLEICIDGFKCCDFKFPRLETFCTMAKLGATKFSISETLIFEPNNSNGHISVTVEKVMDAYSGSRELIIFVPFILYNCMGFPLCVKEASSKTDERGFVIPSYYDVGVNEIISSKRDGLSLLSSSHGTHADVSCEPRSHLNSHTISCRNDGIPDSISFLSNSALFGNYRGNLGRQQRKSNSTVRSSSFGILKRTPSSRVHSTWKYSGSCNNGHEKVVPCMYSPSPSSPVNDVSVKVSGCFPKDVWEKMPYSLWSNSFSLRQPSGSSTICVPQLTSNSAFILAVTSISVSEPFVGRTNAISFQPRYVISNACSKEIIYKQKGTDVTFYLGIGDHAHLHWTDTRRELLVSICYNETGWQWSGSFLPDHLGDTQLKMRNFVFGTSSMIRVEVQNADISMGDEKIVGNIKGNSGTNLILLSDDDTGYMPYRIDNFSKEILRIYQQRCEIFDSVIHSYASIHYTWDEPCRPHRLVVEVPGERILGSYALDDAKEYTPVYLPSTSEKPERTFFVSVHAEGATKILSVLDSNYHSFNELKKSSAPNATEKRLYDHGQVRSAEYKEKISISIPYIGISLINSYPQELLFACIQDIQINLMQNLDRQRLSMRISFIQIDNQLRSTPYPVMLSFDGGYRSCHVDYMKSRDDVTRSRIKKSNQMNSCSTSSIPIFSLEISKWKKKDISFLSFEYIKLRMADFRLEIEQEVILSLFEFFTNISSGLQYGIRPSSNQYYGALLKDSSSFVQTSENLRLNADQSPLGFAPVVDTKSKKSAPLPSIIPIGAPWQEIYLLARTQKKIYIEMFELAPIKLTLSFSSAPWMLRNRLLTSKEFLIHRGLMALADVEGANIYLKDLTIAHHMASWESIQEILIRHYNRQLLHETYKLFGSAGVIGNPLGFARSMGHGIRDFLCVPANNIMQSPTGLIIGMAEGTTSLFSNTLYAISDAASQFSKVARKGIVAFTYDDQIASRMEKEQTSVASGSKGVINEVLEGLTGLLQSPIRGAEKHGLPGVLSGFALGITGLVAKPAASILEVTGKTAQSIRNRSKPNQLRSHCFKVRLPRPVYHELPLRSYSWDEAVGTSVLIEADDGLKFKDEKLVACKALKETGKFVVLTERCIMTVFSPSLINLGKPEFCGIPANLEWMIEWEIGLESIIHADCARGVIHIVGSRPDSSFMHNQHSSKRGSSSRTRPVRWNQYPTHLPLPQTDLELACEDDASNLLQILLSGIEKGKGRAWDCGRILHRASMK